MSLKTLDVAIGVVFLYLLLTFAASAVLEWFASILNWRAQILHETIAGMLRENGLLTVEAIYANPLIQALGRKGAKLSWVDVVELMGWHEHASNIAPSYIPPAAFSAAVLEGLMTKPVTAEQLTPDGFINALSARVAADPSVNALLSVLRTTLSTQGSSIQALRLAIEKWFSDTMDRASGWYKRRTQVVLLLFGALIAFGGHVDTIAVVQWLWQGDAARQSVLSAAQSYTSRTAAPMDAASQKNYLQTLPQQIAAIDRQLTDLQYPIGWWENGRLRDFSLRFLCGAFLTAIAISMGSTFWFDALQSLVKIRGSGPKPGSR